MRFNKLWGFVALFCFFFFNLLDLENNEILRPIGNQYQGFPFWFNQIHSLRKQSSQIALSRTWQYLQWPEKYLKNFFYLMPLKFLQNSIHQSEMKMYVDRNLGLLSIKRKFLASLLLSNKVRVRIWGTTKMEMYSLLQDSLNLLLSSDLTVQGLADNFT